MMFGMRGENQEAIRRAKKNLSPPESLPTSWPRWRRLVVR